MVVVTPINGAPAPVPRVRSTTDESNGSQELAEGDCSDDPALSPASESEEDAAAHDEASLLPRRPQGVPALNIAAAVQVASRAVERGDDEDSSDSSHPEGEKLRKEKGKETSPETQQGEGMAEDITVMEAQVVNETGQIEQGGLRQRGQKAGCSSEVPSTQGDEPPDSKNRTAMVQAAAVVAARRRPGWGMPSFTTSMIGFVALYIAFSFVQLYFVFQPNICNPHKERCLQPLFSSDQTVDIYVFASKSNDFPSNGPPFWNATDVNLQDGISSRAVVPLPRGVRNNGTLFAHVSVVKHGLSPFPKDHVKHGQKRSKKPQVYPYDGLLTMTTPLTRHMRRIFSNHSMLVPSSSSSSSSPNASTSSNGTLSNVTAWSAHQKALDDKQMPQLVAVLLLAFALSGILTPSPPIALLRYAILIALAYFVYPLLPSPSRAASSSAAASTATVANASLSNVFFTEREVITHWKPQLRLRYVTDANAYPEHELPLSHFGWDERQSNLVPRHYQIHNQPHASGSWKYVPIAFVDDFGMQAKHFVPLGTDARLPDPYVVIQFQPISLLRFQVTKFFEGSFEMMKGTGLQERDLDDVKDLVSDTSLRVLGLTYLITFLHVTFDFLAFKNDIGFFRGRETYEGLSSRSLLSSFVCSLIIFLYLLDNDYTSRIVLTSCGVSTLIEGWKAKKVSKATVRWRFLLPWVMSGRGGAGFKAETEAEKRTEEIDAQGMKWLGRVLYPLVIAWAMYSLITRPHKSWWSWAIHSLAHAVYTFGFIGMTPQLFVNYKLKSVAHLPWKAFMYKAFNTFIDDVFSWVIAMPMSHRIACLRDDVVFFVYLPIGLHGGSCNSESMPDRSYAIRYQRYLYPVDKTRPNEFGMAYELPEGEAGEQDSAHPEAIAGGKESKKEA